MVFVKYRIRNTIDFFHPPFQFIFDLQTFRYAVCGSLNTTLDLGLYYICYNFILKKQMIYLPFLKITPHIGAYLLSLLITFPVGFFLARTVVFTNSTVRGKTQLVRYGMMYISNLLLNYFCLKLFVEVFFIYPTISKLLTNCIVIVFSYLFQRFYTFRPAALKRS